MESFTLKLSSDISGWIGAICVLIAYFLISTGKIQKGNRYYHLLNLLGALFLIFNTIYLEAYPSAFVNIIWSFIAISGIMNTKN